MAPPVLGLQRIPRHRASFRASLLHAGDSRRHSRDPLRHSRLRLSASLLRLKMDAPHPLASGLRRSRPHHVRPRARSSHRRRGRCRRPARCILAFASWSRTMTAPRPFIQELCRNKAAAMSWIETVLSDEPRSPAVRRDALEIFELCYDPSISTAERLWRRIARVDPESPVVRARAEGAFGGPRAFLAAACDRRDWTTPSDDFFSPELIERASSDPAFLRELSSGGASEWLHSALAAGDELLPLVRRALSFMDSDALFEACRRYSSPHRREPEPSREGARALAEAVDPDLPAFRTLLFSSPVSWHASWAAAYYERVAPRVLAGKEKLDLRLRHELLACAVFEAARGREEPLRAILRPASASSARGKEPKMWRFSADGMYRYRRDFRFSVELVSSSDVRAARRHLVVRCDSLFQAALISKSQPVLDLLVEHGWNPPSSKRFETLLDAMTSTSSSSTPPHVADMRRLWRSMWEASRLSQSCSVSSPARKRTL